MVSAAPQLLSCLSIPQVDTPLGNLLRPQEAQRGQPARVPESTKGGLLVTSSAKSTYANKAIPRRRAEATFLGCCLTMSGLSVLIRSTD